MDYKEALNLLKDHDGIHNLTHLCREENTDLIQRNAYRNLVVKLAQENTETPSIISQIRSASTAAIDFVKSGFKMVDEEEVERRHNICKSCEHYNAPENRCNVCGCYLKLKQRLESSHCPLPVPKW